MSKKIIISSLAILIGASLAGSVTGTIAWYQYSTRSQVIYTGTSAHCSKLLQLSVDDGDDDFSNNVWGNDIGSALLPSPSFSPVTSADMGKDDPISVKTKYESDGVTPKATGLLYSAPGVGQGYYENWLFANPESYAQFTILVRVKDMNSSLDALANDVYLTDLTIQDASNSNVDLSNAIRVHLAIQSPDSSTKNLLFSKESEETEVGGFLDLNGDGELDESGYEWEKHPCVYGGGTVTTSINPSTGKEEYSVDPSMQYSYRADDSSIIASENSEGEIVGGLVLGKTSASDNEFLKIVVTIWLEGWSNLLKGIGTTTDTSVWDSKFYVDKSFNVGMTFGVKLHSSGE